MVSSVFVLLVGDAGEAPPSTKSGDEGVNCISGIDCALWEREEDIFGMKVKSVPGRLLRGHIVGNRG